MGFEQAHTNGLFRPMISSSLVDLNSQSLLLEFANKIRSHLFQFQIIQSLLGKRLIKPLIVENQRTPKKVQDPLVFFLVGVASETRKVVFNFKSIYT